MGEREEGSGAHEVPAQPFLSARNVSFAVGSVPIIADVGLDISAGRMTGIIGPNGSGKSTLVRLLARQLVPSSGQVTLFGRPAADYDGREFAQHVAYMPQFTPPADGMTVRELVSLGRFPWHGALGRFGGTDAEHVADALRRTDLEHMASRLVDSLSGGERQRCWLAMMFAQAARCVILDEPTSALDIAHQAEMLDLLRTLTRERGVAVVVVLHDVNMAARCCDDLVALAHGRIQARGSPAGIVTADALSGLYGVAMGVVPHPATGQPLSFVQ